MMHKLEDLAVRAKPRPVVGFDDDL